MRRRVLTSLLAVAVVVSFAPTAEAQDIRRYGEQPSSGSGGSGGGGGGGQQSRFYYPGQPVPQQSGNNQAQQNRAAQQQQQQGKGDGEEELEESYAIRIYEPGDYDGMSGQQQQSQQDVPEPVGKPDDKIYQGVIPGLRDTVEHLQQAAATSRTGPNPVTWVGFKASDERTRVFIQTARSPQFSREISGEDNTLIVDIANSKLSERNFARYIDASQYDRVVTQIQANEQPDGTVTVEIKLRASESPEISTSGRYLYIDFPRETTTQSSDESTSGSDQQDQESGSM